MSPDTSLTLLRKQKRRLTKQRRAILAVLRSTDRHPDAYWIYQTVRQQIPNISLGTVYRTLKVLCDTGLARELRYGNQLSRYDGNVSLHGHVTCLSCGRMTDVRIPPNGDFTQVAEQDSGFQIKAFRVEFEGLCPECRSTEPGQLRGPS